MKHVLAAVAISIIVFLGAYGELRLIKMIDTRDSAWFFVLAMAWVVLCGVTGAAIFIKAYGL